MNYLFHTTSKKMMGDLHTPVSIYLKVRDIYPESVLLESSDFHGNENSLSYIALCPLASIGINSGKCTSKFPDRTTEQISITEQFDVTTAMAEARESLESGKALLTFKKFLSLNE